MYIPLDITGEEKWRNAVLEIVPSSVVAARVADASLAAMIPLPVSVGVLEEEPVRVGRSNRPQTLTYRFLGYLSLKSQNSLIQFTPSAFLVPADILNKRVHLKLKRKPFAAVLKHLGLTTSGHRKKKTRRK
jgi:hypothetical protein